MTLPVLAQQTLFLFGLGFLGANVKVAVDFLRYRRQRRNALLVWPRVRPAHYRFSLALGVAQGLLLAYCVFVLHRPAQQLFGLAMMFIYFFYATPVSARIARGFYREGVWSDTGFVRWAQISGVAWRNEGPGPLLLISHIRNIAKRLQVPGHLYGQARKVLRDKVQAHDLHLGPRLGLGAHDERDAV
ncbi:MAG TPA: hypothetical protein VFV95_16105 [Vicinamibacterales bacterium]|nr:hypothetical protein [Vicinamibacterales bacterium]